MTEEPKIWTVGKKIQTKADSDNIVVAINSGEELVPRSALTKKVIKKKKALLADGVTTEEVETVEDIPAIGDLISKKAQDAGLKNIIVEVNGVSVDPSSVQDMDPGTIETIDIRAYDAPR